MAVANYVAKDVLYFNAWWRKNQALVVAVAATSDMAYVNGKPCVHVAYLLKSALPSSLHMV